MPWHTSTACCHHRTGTPWCAPAPPTHAPRQRAPASPDRSSTPERLETRQYRTGTPRCAPAPPTHAPRQRAPASPDRSSTPERLEVEFIAALTQPPTYVTLSSEPVFDFSVWATLPCNSIILPARPMQGRGPLRLALPHLDRHVLRHGLVTDQTPSTARKKRRVNPDESH